MATSSLTPSDLDAIRLILREELEAHGRETVPPEGPEADEFCTLTADDFAVTDIFLTDCQCLFDVTLPDEARLLRKGGDCPAALRVGDRTNLHLVLDRCRVRKVAEGPKSPAVSRAPAEQPATHGAQRRSWARGEMAIGSDADEAAERAAFVAEQPEWGTVLGSELREGDRLVAGRTVRSLNGRLSDVDDDGDGWGSISVDGLYTRRVRPPRPQWATEAGIRWLRSVANGMCGFMSDGTADEECAGNELRRRVPDVARAMLAEVEASR